MELSGQEGTGSESGASTALSNEAPVTVNGNSQTSNVPVAQANGSDNVDSDISMSSDADSDSDTSEDSEAPDQAAELEPESTRIGTENMGFDTNAASRKRKSPEAESPGSQPGDPSASESHKKARLDGDGEKSSVSNGIIEDKSLLPPEVWHHIFTFCPPKTLGNLLSVNKLFHQFLNPSSPDQCVYPPSAPGGVLKVLKAHSIWQSSRRLFWPKMPVPLRSMSELSMWRLLCSTKCQECNKSPTGEQEASPDNVHHGPGADGVTLIWPFGIRVCGPCLVQKAVKEIDLLLSSTFPSTLIPALPFVHITKDLHAVSSSIIEQGLLPANVQVTKIFLASDVQEVKQEFISVKTLGSGTMEEWLKGLEPRGQARLNECRKWEKWAGLGFLLQVRQVTDPYMANDSTAPGAAAAKAVLKLDAQHGQGPVRRTLEEVAELKAARKAEIERRASLLNPPLTREVLRHMISFQAATQLITVLDENAWDLLKPRLLAERSEAEEIEKEVAAQIKSIQAPKNQNSHLEATLATTKEAKDAVDRDWEVAQAPLRLQIVRYVDEFIRESWDKGKKVKQDNCARFAAEALIHIRKRFYAQVAKDAEKARAACKEPATDPPEGPFLHKLTLENMRWIFDTKIKPLTAPFKKEVFFCNGCAAKPFGFEGVIQHYAAKHTEALSSGNIVVHWRAEWPEEPPFNPEGRMKVVQQVAGPTSHPPGTVPPPVYPSNSYAPPPGPGVPAPGQYAPGSAYAGAPYAEQHGYQYPGYVPNNTYTPATPAQSAQPYVPPQPGWTPYPYNPTPPQAVGYQPPIQAPRGPVPTPPVPGPYSYGPGGYQGAHVGAYVPPQAPYPVQLEDIVRNSRDLWGATAPMRDLPGSVRVFVTIFHVVKRFHARFSQTPSLAIFQDGLSNHKDMRPVRNINGLACKACQLGLGNAPYIQKDRDSFSLPQLVNHFQSKHVEEMLKDTPELPPLDWIHDMILLPHPAVLAKLPSTVQGLDASKHKLLSEALPDAFGQAPAAHSAPFYGAQPLQHVAYQQAAPYPAAAPPPAVHTHEQTHPQQQPPPQYQHQPAREAQHVYQPQTNYGQGPSPHGYDGPAQASANLTDASTTDNDSNRDTTVQEATNGRSQGFRQRPQQNDKWSRKDRRKHAQNDKGGQNRRPRSNDEEPNLPDEEKAREEEMRAMWANDRAATARVLSAPEPREQDTTKIKQSPQQPAPLQSRGDAREETLKREPAAQRNNLPPPAESSLLDALEMHLDQGHTRVTERQPAPKHPPQAVSMDNSEAHRNVAAETGGRQVQHPADPSSSNKRGYSPVAPYAERAQEAHSQSRVPEPRQYGEYDPRDPAPTRAAPREVEYEPRYPPAPVEYRDVAPAAHQPYARGYRDEEEVIYERHPQDERFPQDYRHRSAYPEELIPPPPRGPPTGQLYEIVEVIDSQGSYFIRRPIGRAPPPEEVYYDYLYEPERARERHAAPVGAGRSEPLPYPPRPVVHDDDRYSRPPPPRPIDDDRYYNPPPATENSYPQQRQPPSSVAHPLSQQQQHRYGEEYPPRPPPGSAPHNWASDYIPTQYDYHPRQRQSTARPPEQQHGGRGVPPAVGGYPAANKGVGEEGDEYDPRFPAGAGSPPGPPGRGPGPGPGQVAQYQRRQVRYED